MPLGNIKGYRNPPHYSKFSILDRETNVILRGTPDGIMGCVMARMLLSTTRPPSSPMHQDELFPMYEVQLNAYALIGQQKGLAPVSGLALVYTEPVTDDATAAKDGNQTNTGFLMEFSAHIRRVDLLPENIPPLLARVREIYDRKRPPNPKDGCNDCARLQDLLRLAGG